MVIDETYEDGVKARKYSVVCSCGHRIFINPKKTFAICYYCGRKHISPKEEFKNKLNNLMGKMVDRKVLERS